MLAEVYDAFFGPAVRLAPTYLLAFVALAFAIHAVRMRALAPGRFLRWLFPRAIYRHPSSRTDLQLFAVNRLLSLAGAMNAVGLQTLTSVAVIVGLSRIAGEPTASGEWSTATAVLVTVAIVLTSDFCTYWIHRAHHELPMLWPFHAVHHSAEVLTPITLYRKHPVYDLIAAQARALLIGVAVGVLLFCVTDRIDVLTLGGTNAAYFLFHLLGSNFRHSHVWISYGRVLGHVLISPAQHQVHHSRAVEHHDRNYGELLAIWDWMFGTLYVPERRLELEMGLSDREGRPIPQPHGTFCQALLVPFRDAWTQLGAGRRATERAGVQGPQP